MNWVEFNFITPPNVMIHSRCWAREGRNKKLNKGASIIWHADIWTIWNMRNDRIFNNKSSGWMKWWTKLRCYPGIGV
jgi:hypothetical protein